MTMFNQYSTDPDQMLHLQQQQQQQQQLQQQSHLMLNRDDAMTMNLQDPPKMLAETTSTGIPAFPWKLHDVLEDAERKGFANVISWTMNGRAFKVHDQKQFEDKIMTKYFNQTQYKSFQRQ
jgi:hypothetical protein